MTKSYYISDNGGTCVLLTMQTIVSTSVMDVDYSKTITSLTNSKGFNTKDGHILRDENFPSKGVGQQNLDTAIFHFNDTDVVDSLESAISEMEKFGYRPATIKELLSYPVEKLPDNFRVFKLLALGSSTDFAAYHSVNICSLVKVEGKDHIQLEAIAAYKCFGYDFRFLGVKK